MGRVCVENKESSSRNMIGNVGFSFVRICYHQQEVWLDGSSPFLLWGDMLAMMMISLEPLGGTDMCTRHPPVLRIKLIITDEPSASGCGQRQV